MTLASNALSDQPDQYGSVYELYHGEGTGPSHVQPSTIMASSTLVEGALRHDPNRAADRDLSTAWCEGVPGTGENASLPLTLAEPTYIAWVQIWGWYFCEE